MNMQVSGAILIDKPPFITSYDVIRQLKGLLPAVKIGHTGTLDPIATGLMILLLGTATKLAGYFLKLSKVYTFTVRFGQETDTMDSAGTIIKECDYTHITTDALIEAVQSLTGIIEQHPPAYSAIKYRGRPLYEYARKGQKVEVSPRMVKITDLSMNKFYPPYAEFTAAVSSGTYIRSLAKSIGDGIGCCAHVTELRRLSIGGFTVGQALQLHKIKQHLTCNAHDYSFLIDGEILMNEIRQNDSLGNQEVQT